jgi:hypothetical protein
LESQNQFRPGDLFAESGSPLNWPLPWPARLIVAVDGKGDARLPGWLGMDTFPMIEDGDILWTDTYGTGVCSRYALTRRNGKYGLVHVGNLIDP